MNSNKLSVCISDADVLVKLSITGHLGIMGKVFEQVFVVSTVENEAKRKIGRRAKGVTFFQAQKEGFKESPLRHKKLMATYLLGYFYKFCKSFFGFHHKICNRYLL